MQDVKLSIIVTCYNLGQYLNVAIENLVSLETEGVIELIIVNDGSTNMHTIEVIKEIETKYHGIKLLHQNNQGLAKARNNGIAIAKGDYIIPLDADNKLRPLFIEQTIALLDTNEYIDVVYGNAQLFGKKEDLWKGKDFDVEEILLNNYIDACAGFRKSAWKAVGGYDSDMPVMGFEDWDLWLRMMVRGFKFKYVNEIFFDYRVRDNSMLDVAWSKRDSVIDYMFDKKELKHLKPFRDCIIENKKLKQEPSVSYLFATMLKKIKRTLGI